jgi:NRPS condensation-like uncharacterized protein
MGEFMLHLELEFGHQLNEQRLDHALALLLDAHPILGCRFVADPHRPYWEILGKEQLQIFFMTTQERAYNQFRISHLKTREEPQLKACLLRSSQGDRLLLKISHQLCDAGGVKDIAEDLSGLYARLEKDPHYRPLPNGAGSRGLDQIIRQIPWYAHPVIVFNFMRVTLSNQVPQNTHQLLLHAVQRAPLTFILRHIPADRMSRIAAHARQHQATVNDSMAAAFQRALVVTGRWDGRAALRVQTTVDLRRWYLPAERTAGICNLSTHEYANLGTQPGSDFSATLKRVCAITRKRKKSWVGLTEVCLAPLLGTLKYSALLSLISTVLKQRIARGNMPNSLTNLGPIDAESVVFGERPRKAWILPPVIYPPLFFAGFSGYAGSLTLSAGVPEASAGMVEKFFDQMLAELPG